MSKVVVVTDSTAYLPDEMAKQYGIIVLPLSIIWEGTSYRDGIDIQPADFYGRLKVARELPTTSQVTAPAFEAAFKDVLQAGDRVLGIFVSSRLSGTYDAAVQAQQAIGADSDTIAIVDSGLTTVAMAMPVLVAARAAQSGESLSSCQTIVQRACSQTGVLFVVETLEFMRRGGRIGGAQAFLGTLLSIKPLLGMHEGAIEAVERIRRKHVAVDRMIDLTEERIAGRTPLQLAASHADADAEAEELLAAASARMNPVRTLCRPLSPVIGSHVGPGTVSLAYMVGFD
jgi:DegV family protein with EDD domain